MILHFTGLDAGQYRFHPNKFVNLVVPSPCETEPYNGLLTKCEVKTAGLWPSSFSVRLWTETESHIHLYALHLLIYISFVKIYSGVWIPSANKPALTCNVVLCNYSI